MKKLIFTLIGVFAVILGAEAQQEPQFTQYFDNTLYVNPAYAGSKEMLNITAIHREQYVGFDGRPRSTTLTLHSPLRYESVGLGLSLVNDMIGPVRQTMIYGDVSYSLKFKNNTKLSFGVKGGINIMNLDVSELSNGSKPVGAITSFSNRINPNFGVGILYHGPKFFFGISTPKLIQTKIASINTLLELRHYYITAGYVAHLSPKFKLRPSAQFKFTDGAPFSLDLSLAAICNEKFWIGGTYRWDAAVGVFVQFMVSPQFKIGLASDFGTQKIRNYNHGTFEALLSYSFKYANKGIVSPRYF